MMLSRTNAAARFRPKEEREPGNIPARRQGWDMMKTEAGDRRSRERHFVPQPAGSSESVFENPGSESRLEAVGRGNRLKAGLRTRRNASEASFQTRSER
jgi:hypothetical protein